MEEQKAVAATKKAAEARQVASKQAAVKQAAAAVSELAPRVTAPKGITTVLSDWELVQQQLAAASKPARLAKLARLTKLAAASNSKPEPVVSKAEAGKAEAAVASKVRAPTCTWGSKLKAPAHTSAKTSARPAPTAKRVAGGKGEAKGEAKEAAGKEEAKENRGGQQVTRGKSVGMGRKARRALAILVS